MPRQPEDAGKPADTKKGAILARLENLVKKMRVQYHDFSELDFRIFPPLKDGSPYVIEMSKGHFVRRVLVDQRTAQRLDLWRLDANLVRELRSAMLGIARLARDRK